MKKIRPFRGGEFLIVDALPDEVFTPEEISKQDRMIGKAAKDFALRELVPRTAELECKDYELMRSLLKKAADLGLSSLMIPEAYGGSGAGFVSSTVAFDNINQGVPTFIYAFAMQAGIGTLATILFGTQEQRKNYGSRLASGEMIGAYALTEPQHGSDALGAESTAVLSEDGKYYELNGLKSFSTNAGFADMWSTYAQVDGKFTSFIVERGWDGVSLDEEEDKMGLHGSSTRGIVFRAVKVPVENVLGGIGRGHVVALNALNIGRWKVGAMALGTAKALLAEVLTYAKARYQFNKPLVEFGLIKHKIAEMVIRCYVLESMVYRTARTFDFVLDDIDLESDQGGLELGNRIKEYAVEGSICKIFGSEAQSFVADECVQTMGGYGYIKGNMVERTYRDVRIQRIWEGTNEINRILITKTLMNSAKEGRIPLPQAIKEAQSSLEKDGGAPSEGDGCLQKEQSMTQTAKKIVLAAIGLSLDKIANATREEQEIEALIADMAIAIFGMESALLRARKNVIKSGEEKAGMQAQIASAFINASFPKVLLMARQVIAASLQGAELDRWLSIIKKHDLVQDADLIPVRRDIADKVVAVGRYPFARI